MKEPRLEDISDYENLDSEKKRTFIAIALTVLIMGVIYALVASFFDNSEDAIEVQETLKIIPMK